MKEFFDRCYYPVLGQIEGALRALDHEVSRVGVAGDVEAVVSALRSADPALVFNLAESFDGKSALESNVAALLNLMGLRYTGSSPAGLLMAGDKSLTKQLLGFRKILTPQFATIYRGACDRVGELGGLEGQSADVVVADGVDEVLRPDQQAELAEVHLGYQHPVDQALHNGHRKVAEKLRG